jgi:hypothetical protein
MSKRFDNKRILYILAGLIVLLALTVMVKVPRERASIRSKLVEIDTARVNKIILTPRMNEGASFEFIKKSGRWIIQQGNIVAAPEKDVVQNILMEVQDIKPKSLEAVDRAKWKDFSVTDSLAIRVQFLDEKEKKLADLMIGRFDYSQANNQYVRSNPNGIQGTSYVRLSNEKKVYGVDGFLSLSFSGKFNDYRDRSFLSVSKNDVIKISFMLPSDSSFILSKKDSVWYAGSTITDSLATADYLNGLRYINGEEFRDNFKPAGNPVCELSVEGNNLLSISVKCYNGDKENEYILNSSLNPDAYFVSRKDGIFDKLFKSERYFITKSTKKSH